MTWSWTASMRICLMDFRNWYCVQVASGCENKSRADLMARKEVLQRQEHPECGESRDHRDGCGQSRSS